MVIDRHTFTDLARHLHGISEGMLDGMKKVVALNPETLVDKQALHAEWMEAVDAFLRVNQEVLTMAELMRALLSANEEPKPDHPLVS